MMSFMPYMHFSGNCAEAMTFYCNVFGGTDLQMMKYTDLPGGMDSPPTDRIMHSQFTANGAVLMASDIPPFMPDGPQQAVSVMIDPATLTEAQRLFAALAEDGTVAVPLGPTDWSPGFGMVADRFGTSWIIGTQPAP